MQVEDSKHPIDYREMAFRVGKYTRSLIARYSTSQPISLDRALQELNAEFLPLHVRLTSYIAKRFNIPNEVSAAKRVLREASQKKGLEISSSNLSQWFSFNRGEIYLSQRSVFKLCLALDLNIDESVRFVYDCLYQNWFNYREIEDCVYFFYLGMQDLFPDEAYSHACIILQQIESFAADKEQVADAFENATGFTSSLGTQISDFFDKTFETPQQAEQCLLIFLKDNLALFTGIQRSARKTYDMYFKTGGVGLKPLRDLYYEATGFVLPETSYLDVSGVGADVRRKRLLWGSFNRSTWIAKNGKDWDILNENEIRIEHHALKRMLEGNVARGNIIALLFFHYCLEYGDDFKRSGNHRALFGRFYKIVNTTLIDECGMMPLHPRKPLDRLFLLSMAASMNENPIDYFNRLLEKFYKV